ncbi:hypothetical protein NUU61_006206 [Penicillium alfredii]|uniref:HNH nuclease domain-containing protein n=1 Tax=Penicillium alfredii TaxID=1506179 RepID=A0A9W9K3I8_9EURO|nr:uncharacterized protein NUU61_006206 [Penicillium alfredii]KAJ5091336.1 hypothetical protein NUU61_006206 [Penicillium alfredii]
MSQQSLSPSVSSNNLNSFLEARQTLDRKLAGYKPLGPDDSNTDFLQVFFKYLGPDGQANLAEDVHQCVDDDGIRQLVRSLDTGLLRPMRANGGITSPFISPRFGVEDSIENLLADDTHSLNREQQRLRNHCLARDGQRCVITNAWNSGYTQRPNPSVHAPLVAAHIIPFALGQFQENAPDDRYRHASIWTNLNRYFPELRSRLHFSSEDINEEQNVMMMVGAFHDEFGSFHFVLEATETPNRYRLKEFSNFASLFLPLLPQNRIVILNSHDGRYPPPNPILLAVHAAVGNILNLTAHGEKIEELKQELGDMGGGLARDGSTRIGDLLSVSKLSLLSTVTNNRPEKKKQRRLPPIFTGAENESPNVTR